MELLLIGGEYDEAVMEQRAIADDFGLVCEPLRYEGFDILADLC